MLFKHFLRTLQDFAQTIWLVARKSLRNCDVLIGSTLFKTERQMGHFFKSSIFKLFENILAKFASLKKNLFASRFFLKLSSTMFLYHWKISKKKIVPRISTKTIVIGRVRGPVRTAIFSGFFSFLTYGP